jgi:alkylhydroperoxidase family enzyme
VPRIRYLTGDESSEIQKLLADVIERRGYASNVHRCLAHSPNALRAFERFSAHVNGSSLLDSQSRELIILRTAQLVGNEYEWRRHVPKALDAGVSLEELRGLHDWKPDQYPLPHRAALQLTDEYIRGLAVTEDTLESVRVLYGEELLIEILITLGWYLLVSAVILPLDVIADDPPSAALAVPFNRVVISQ